MSLTSSTRGVRVVVVGAINVDLVVRAPNLPVPGETVVGPSVTRHGGGKGANSAVAAARAGAQVSFVGAVGADAAATEAEFDLLADGVNCDGVQRVNDAPTGMALIVVDPHGENQIAVGAGANHALDPEHVRERISRLAGEIDCVLVSTEIPSLAVIAAVRAAAAAGIRCVLNPAPPIVAVLEATEYAPILTPNRVELGALLKLAGGASHVDCGADASPEEQAHALGAATGVPLCVTLGADGVLLWEAGEITRVATASVTALDATGAGDTFNGVLAVWLAGGASLRDAGRAATTAASLSVAAVGARSGMPQRDDILSALATAGDI